jgi:hypothetical protein
MHISKNDALNRETTPEHRHHPINRSRVSPGEGRRKVGSFTSTMPSRRRWCPKHHHRQLRPSAKSRFSPGSTPEDLCPAHQSSHRAPLHCREEQPAPQQPPAASSEEEAAPTAAPHGDHLRSDAGTTAGRSEPPCPTEPHAARKPSPMPLGKQRSTARGLEPPRFQATVTQTKAEAARDHLLATAKHRRVQIRPKDPAAQSPEPPPPSNGVRPRPAAAPPSWSKPPAPIRKACAGTPPRPPRAPATWIMPAHSGATTPASSRRSDDRRPYPPNPHQHSRMGSLLMPQISRQAADHHSHRPWPAQPKASPDRARPIATTRCAPGHRRPASP